MLHLFPITDANHLKGVEYNLIQDILFSNVINCNNGGINWPDIEIQYVGSAVEKS
jgi:hypothetical protein